jgi:NAD(P)-dependent dehydrogenase (short-subunit alcohol dehydrogenase family)
MFPPGVKAIGFTCAATFAGEGANVVVVDRDGDAAERACDSIVEAGGRSIPVVADLLVEGQAAATVEAGTRQPRLRSTSSPRAWPSSTPIPVSGSTRFSRA